MRYLERFFGKYRITDKASLDEALVKENYNRGFAKSLRNFITFLKNRGLISRTEYLDLKDIIKLKPTGVRRVYVSDEQIRIAYEYYLQKDPLLALIYEALVYSGQRLKHIVRMLNEFDPDKLVLYGDNVAKYPMSGIGRGQKQTFWAYFPREFAERLERVDISYKRVHARMRVKIRSIRNTEKSVVFSSSAVRKWFSGFLARQGVPLEVIDYIQGRAPRTVIERHYLNLELLADEWYSAVVDDLKRVLEDERR
ncbi:integrase [Thermococcus sp. GR7]|uniref:integrase n=1 Tax=unclassified Thermococcus TaxID=2627626 RepID=UPI00143073D1|nr:MULTISPECIES: integrase [unclassified Thermococcus]NJE47310.1 integrase [Thermococcus sp. GR7]NJE78675.1 integrase [Thermococcus sp. GR4]NJF23200.1 integrase [Thermococcus sp. GR5]